MFKLFYKSKKRIAAAIFILFIVLLPLNSLLAGNVDTGKSFWDKLQSTAGKEGAGFAVETTTPQTLSVAVGVVIRIILAFVGVIFFILVIYAGILWMTARGNEEQAKKAKKIMADASIGLAVTLAAYIITFTVIAALA